MLVRGSIIWLLSLRVSLALLRNVDGVRVCIVFIKLLQNFLVLHVVDDFVLAV